MQKSPSPERPQKRSPETITKTGYYHDQRGMHHDARRLIVPEFFEKLDEQIREEYLEGKKDASRELEQIEKVLPLITDDPWAREKLASLIDHCAAYADKVLRQAINVNDASDDDPMAFINAMVASDKRRREKHEALMKDVKELQAHLNENYGPKGKIRVLDESSLPVIYTGADQTREAYGHWALRVADVIARLSDEKREALLDQVFSDQQKAAE